MQREWNDENNKTRRENERRRRREKKRNRRRRKIIRSRLITRRWKNSKLNEYVQPKINFKNPNPVICKLAAILCLFLPASSTCILCAERAFNIKFQALIPPAPIFSRRYFTCETNVPLCRRQEENATYLETLGRFKISSDMVNQEKIDIIINCNIIN